MIAHGLPEYVFLAPAVRDAVGGLWAELQHELSGRGDQCAQCGECCDFPRSRHLLFAEGLEARYAAAVATSEEIGNLARGWCPFYREARCLNRAGRPLGCRTFFCRPGGRTSREELYEKYLRRLRLVGQTWGFAVDYRPFLDHLQEIYRGPGAAARGSRFQA